LDWTSGIEATRIACWTKTEKVMEEDKIANTREALEALDRVQLKVMSPPESVSFSVSYSFSFSFLFILYLYLSPRPFLTKEKEKE
jgi:hypothetical protein